jgi:hypothetical protein
VTTGGGWGVRDDIRQHIQPNREFEIARIEIYQVIGARGRNMVQQFFGQVAVGVNDANAVTKGDVLDDQVTQEGCLAGTGLSDDLNVLALVGGRYAKRLRLPPAVAFSNHDVRVVVHGSKTSRHSCHREVPVYRLPEVT